MFTILTDFDRFKPKDWSQVSQRKGSVYFPAGLCCNIQHSECHKQARFIRVTLYTCSLAHILSVHLLPCVCADPLKVYQSGCNVSVNYHPQVWGLSTGICLSTYVKRLVPKLLQC